MAIGDSYEWDECPLCAEKEARIERLKESYTLLYSIVSRLAEHFKDTDSPLGIAAQEAILKSNTQGW